MKKKLFTVMATIVVICAVCVNNVNAQCFRYYDRGAGLFGDGVDFYAGFGAGAALVNDMASPAFSVRVGAEAGLFIGEIEGSYLSVNSLYDDGFSAETNTLSTMTLGLNLGVKFLSSSYGHLALMVHTGYALQEEWFHGDYPYDYHHGHAYHGRYYLGVGLNGSVNLSSRIALFGEAVISQFRLTDVAKSSGAASLPEELSFIFNYSFSAAGEILPFLFVLCDDRGAWRGGV